MEIMWKNNMCKGNIQLYCGGITFWATLVELLMRYWPLCYLHLSGLFVIWLCTLVYRTGPSEVGNWNLINTRKFFCWIRWHWSIAVALGNLLKRNSCCTPEKALISQLLFESLQSPYPSGANLWHGQSEYKSTEKVNPNIRHRSRIHVHCNGAYP
jgi:hypothetical protein